MEQKVSSTQQDSQKSYQELSQETRRLIDRVYDLGDFFQDMLLDEESIVHDYVMVSYGDDGTLSRVSNEALDYFSYNNNGKLCIYKRPLPASLMRFKIPADAHVIMGHTRITTQGSAKKNYNNHPFLGQAGDDAFALAHNGVLWNDYELRHERQLPHTKIETDSYIAVQLIEQQKALHPQSLKNMAEELEGSFCFTVLDQQDNLYVVKGDNPICIYHWPAQQLYLYASTEEILKAALAKMPVSFGKPHPVLVDEGWILKITCDAVQTMTQFDTTRLDVRWYYYSRWPVTPPAPKTPSSPVSEYINELKRMAERLGFSGREVDALLSDGFTADEVADFLYEGAF